MTACAGHRYPPITHTIPRHSSLLIMNNHKVAPTPLKDSGRTPTSSFRAQSRNPCFPALQLGCCDYAQHDGVCRAPLPPITHTIPRHSSLLIMGNHKVAPTPLKDSGRTPTSSFRAQSRNPCFPALQLGCCDYAQHDGVCRAPLPPHHPHHSPSFLTPHHGQPQGCAYAPQRQRQNPNFVIPRAVAESMFPCTPTWMLRLRAA